MPKDKLLIALLITIAAIAGIFYFHSSVTPVSTGQLAALCLGALGWTGLFISPVGSDQNHAISSNTHTGELASSLSGLFNTIQAQLNDQITATEAELNQVKSLMDSAIDDLVDSFMSLEATTRIGQHLVGHMISSESNSKDELNPFRDRQMKSQALLNDTSDFLKKLIKNTKHNIATSASLAKLDKISDNDTAKILSELQANSDLIHENTKEVSYKVADMIDENKAIIALVSEEMAATNAQVAEDVHAAIKSLQFQDTTTQLITQCTERLNVMQKMLGIIESLGNSNTAAQSVQEWQIKLTAANDALKEANNLRIKQFNVDPGSVELFV